MNQKAFAAALCLAAAFAIGCSSLQARRELADGKLEYRKTNFESAAKHFRAAVALDDDWVGAKFALAGAYVADYVPGVPIPENERHAQDAIEVFNKILQRDPRNASALKDLAILYLEMGRADSAVEYGKKAVAAAPDDPDLYYLLGAVQWVRAYKNIQRHKAELGLRMNESPTYSGDTQRLCAQIRSDNEAGISEGLAMLEKAMAMTPNYDDAMAYSSLLYQLKAEMECGNPRARTEDLRLSQKWIDEGISARERKGKNPQANPRIDFGAGLETGKLDFLIMPPPPPPPPSREEVQRVPQSQGRPLANSRNAGSL